MRPVDVAVGCATALSAFLLLLVQPLVARQILPWFGGSAAVWSTCLLFFQTVLVGGYLYADTLVRHLPPRRQAIVHGSLLALSLVVLPIGPAAALRPPDATLPVPRILLLLTVTVGLPYGLLSASGPLLQAWWLRRRPTARVWRLYALSNLFSLLALLVYPAVLEPLATTGLQARLWSIGYGVLTALLAVLAWQQTRWTPPPQQAPGLAAADRDDGPTVLAEADDGQRLTNGAAAPPRNVQQVQWLALAALGSAMLVAVTTHLTQNIASVPLLWVVPLGLYLLSFVLCFDGRRWYARSLYPLLAAAAVVVMTVCLSYRPDGHGGLARGLLPVRVGVPLYGAGLLAVCLFVHGELEARKPPPQWLTRFYLLVSLGGALGGAAVTLGAPLLFNDYWELPLALLAAAVLLAALAPYDWQRPVGVVAALLVACLCVDFAVFRNHDVVARTRNFYGTLRVKAAGPDIDPRALMRLVHGTILHGEQARERRREAGSYYGASSGVGHAIRDLRSQDSAPAHQRVGLIGMGVGTLTAYARPGDLYRLYEINPAVPALARSHFSYVEDCAGHTELALGDARLSLEREPPQAFDVLAIDAFSGDAIPVHMVTAEALAVYRRHLRPGGVVAFHLSNRYLRLAPVVARLADDAGLLAWQFIDSPPRGAHLSRSDWVVVTANSALVMAWRAQGVGQPPPRQAGLPTWRDDQYDLMHVLK